MDAKLLDKLSESFSDGENIAKSAISMAIERSQDLNLNPVLTLTMVKTIATIAMEDYREHFTTEHPLGRFEQEIGIFSEMENFVDRTIREEFRQTKAKSTGG
jgi:hypothetical protein